jgi:hypothetical protein
MLNFDWSSSMMKAKPLYERLMSRVDVVPIAGCWIWMGPCQKNGYGYLNHHISRRNNKHIRAHRASWLVHRGEIPDGLHVLHKCDVPQCVNPDHLFLGTRKDNMMDCSRKGRTSRKGFPGLENPKAKLSVDDVREILRLYRHEKMRQVDIASRFNVVQTAISKIVCGLHWTQRQGLIHVNAA